MGMPTNPPGPNKPTEIDLPDDFFEHIVSATCRGEYCHCGRPATHKVGEEFAFDNKQQRHNFTAYLCCYCFGDLFGPAARQFCKQERAIPTPTDSEGLPIPDNEPDDAEILVWEIDPHLQSREYDICLERSWQRMLSFVDDHLATYLENFDEADLEEGVNVRFRLVRMRNRDYADIVLGSTET